MVSVLGEKAQRRKLAAESTVEEMASAKSTSGTGRFMNEKTGTGAAEYLGLN
jgi:hypothetical protein